MKKISFLAFFTLLFMAVEVITAFVDIWGYTNPRTLVEERTQLKQEQVEAGSRIGTKLAQELNVMPADDELSLDSVQNTRFNVQTPYAVKSVVACGWAPWWMGIFSIFLLPVLPLFIWGIVNFVKLLVSVFKHEIFTRKNARRLRIFVYTTNGSLAIISLYDWLVYHCIANQTTVAGYVISNYEFAISWSDMFLMLLFAEIFALGVKLQEEQELTI